MKIEDILKKQGELYKNLSSSKIVQKSNKVIPNFVKYKNYQISKQEHKVIIELEKLLGREPTIVDGSKRGSFEISINNNKIIYLKITYKNLNYVPEQIKKLENLEKLDLSWNDIKKIENLNNLRNLQELHLRGNELKEIRGLDNLINLKTFDLGINKITKIENLDNLINLQELSLSGNKITKIENLDNLQNLRELYLSKNKIETAENLKNLLNLQELYLSESKIKKVGNLPKNLRTLYLDYNYNLSKIKNLGKLQNIEELRLHYTNITKIKCLCNLKNLRRVWLQWTSKENKKIVEKLRKQGVNALYEN